MSSSSAVVEVATAAVPMVVAESVLVATTEVTVVEMFAAGPTAVLAAVATVGIDPIEVAVVAAVAVAAADLLEVRMVADPMMLLGCYRPALMISSCYSRLLMFQRASLSIVLYRADYKGKSHQYHHCQGVLSVLSESHEYKQKSNNAQTH